MGVARRWRVDPEQVERWHPDTWLAVTDLLATEEIQRRRHEHRQKARR